MWLVFGSVASQIAVYPLLVLRGSKLTEGLKHYTNVILARGNNCTQKMDSKI